MCVCVCVYEREWVGGLFGLKHQSVCRPFACFTLCCILSGAKRFCVFGIGQCAMRVGQKKKDEERQRRKKRGKAKWATLGKMHKICAYIIWLGVRPAKGVCVCVWVRIRIRIRTTKVCESHCCCCLWLHYFHKYACGMRQFVLLIKMQRRCSSREKKKRNYKKKKKTELHTYSKFALQLIEFLELVAHFLFSPPLLPLSLDRIFQLHRVRRWAWLLGQLISVTSPMDFPSKLPTMSSVRLVRERNFS